VTFNRIYLFRRISCLRSALGQVRCVKKINQIEPEISKADRIKKLHYENKMLYGAALTEPKNKKKKAPVKQEVVAVEHKTNDLSSEIYWTCLHVPEVPDFTKSKKADKKSKPPKEKAEKKLKPPKEKAEKPAKKKVPQKEIIKLPESLEKLHENLFPVAVKVNIRNTLDASFKVAQIESDTSSGDSSDENIIPFEQGQLREMTNFPMILGNHKVLDVFDKFITKESAFPVPSVSKVLQATMPLMQRKALMQWKTLKIAELGLEGFELMQKCKLLDFSSLRLLFQLCFSPTAHLSRGKKFHKCLQNHFNGESVDVKEMSPEVVSIWNSIEPILHTFQSPGVLIEKEIAHPYLYYKGIVDCVSYHNSLLSVIEWKKSDRHKKLLSFTYDAPIQLVAYLGALNAENLLLDKPIERGVVVVAYNDGSPANLFALDEKELRKYWKLWLNRLQEYWVRYKDNTLPTEPL